MAERIRCTWAEKNELERNYHDTEWGIPVHDDKKLFKMLILEGMQAGLSWATILRKMDTLCHAFDDFDPEIISKYDENKIEELMNDIGVIRNRQKINATISNANSYLNLCERFGSLDEFMWGYIDYTPIINAWVSNDEVPSKTELSDRISKDLKKWGFKYVGSTTIYAFMQSVGMVNDHLVTCAFKTRIGNDTMAKS